MLYVAKRFATQSQRVRVCDQHWYIEHCLFALDFFAHVFLYSYGCLLLYMVVPPPSVMNLPVVLVEIKFVDEQKDQTQQIYRTLLTHQSEMSVVCSNTRCGLPVP